MLGSAEGRAAADRPQRYLTGEQRALAIIFVVANVLGLALTLLGVWLKLGWISATLAAAFGFALESLWIIWRRGPRFSVHCWSFGLIAGFVELAADRWLVERLGVLVYAPGGPFVLSSPLYMPFAWGGMLQAGLLLGLWLERRWSLPVACLCTAVLFGLYLPLFEHLAHGSSWWSYRRTPLLAGTTPWFIVLGEILIGASLPLFARWLARDKRRWSPLVGVAAGIWIGVAYALAWSFVGLMS